MKPPICVSLIVCIGLAACSTSDSATKSRSIGGPGAESADTKFDGPTLSSADYKLYGEPVHEGPSTAVPDIVANPASFEAVPVRLKGPIMAVCQTKGCWVRVGTPDNNVLVDFKAAGFAVPKNAEGQIIICEGGLKADEPDIGVVGGGNVDAVTLEAVGAAIPKRL